jgi:hypothetical protein
VVGEGDEKIYVDGETFPSHFGTGTEDYYGYAWCCPIPFVHPFHGQPRADGHKHGDNNWGHTTVSRVRALDAIPFTKSFKFDMEIWHWRECEEAYAATTFFYAAPGATTNRQPQPADAAAPSPKPPPLPPALPHHRREARPLSSLTPVRFPARPTASPIVNQDMYSFARRKWSEESQLWVHAKDPGDFVEFNIPTGDGPEAISQSSSPSTPPRAGTTASST